MGVIDRRTLLGSVAAVAMMEGGLLARPALAAPAGASGGLQAFTTLSKRLIERDDLDPGLARLYYDALVAAYPGFDDNVGRALRELDARRLTAPQSDHIRVSPIADWY